MYRSDLKPKLFSPETLKYGFDELGPVFSENAMSYHYYHYCKLIEDYNTLSQKMALEKIDGCAEAYDAMKSRTEKLYKAAWLHARFFEVLAPTKEGGGELPKYGTVLLKELKQKKNFGKITIFYDTYHEETRAKETKEAFENLKT